MTLNGAPPLPAFTIGDVIAWLIANIDAFRWDETGPDAHQQLTAMHLRMVRAVDRSASRVFAGRCDAEIDGGRCTEPLYAWPGSDKTVVCDGYRPVFERADPKQPRLAPNPCRAEHSRTGRVAWLIEVAGGQLYPMDFWAEHLPPLLPELRWPTRTTWAKWAAKMDARAVIDEVPLFRGDDVIEKCADQQDRIIANTTYHRSKRDRKTAVSATPST